MNQADELIALETEGREALSAGGAAYSAPVSSAYVRRGGAWRLALHQQTPR